MNVGIEKISLYPGRLAVDSLAIAEARGVDPEAVRRQVMIETRTIVPPWEDAVTLAVNAARLLVTDDDRRDIELVIAATESAPDFGKPLSGWVHRHLGLSAGCFGFEIKNACYGATAALKTAALWVRASLRPGKKALVVSADLTHRSTDTGMHIGGGGCGVAMLVSADPEVLELDLETCGYWTSEIADVFRPTPRDEVVNVQLSLYAYLDALDGAYDAFVRHNPATNYRDFARHIYHAPIPGMTLTAHRALLERVDDALDADAHYEQTVADGTRFGRRIGTAYGASNFVSLLSHLTVARDLAAGDRVSFFAYGSGSQGELSSGRIGRGAIAWARSLDTGRMIAERRTVSVADYERVEAARDAADGIATHTVDQSILGDAYDAMYAGRKLLVLRGVNQFARDYAWS